MFPNSKLVRPAMMELTSCHYDMASGSVKCDDGPPQGSSGTPSPHSGPSSNGPSGGGMGGGGSCHYDMASRKVVCGGAPQGSPG